MTEKVTGTSLKYLHLIHVSNKDVWTHNLANDLHRLTQGVGTRMPTSTNTVFSVWRHYIPAGRKITYACLVSSIRPHKTEMHRIRVTFDGDILDFLGITTIIYARLTTTKCPINSTVFTPLAKFMTLEIINFYYSNPMEWYQYMRMSLDMIPKQIIAQY